MNNKLNSQSLSNKTVTLTMPLWKKRLLKKLIRKKGAPVFLHIPKTGGTSVQELCDQYRITYLGHHPEKARKKRKRMRFTVIREPGKRFESFLHYRLQGRRPRRDFRPRTLHSNKNLQLDEIVGEMTNKTLTGFSPFSTQCLYAKHVDICFQLHELPEAFHIMLGLTDLPKLPKHNSSKKTRKNLSGKSLRRIRKVYFKDVKLWEKWTRLH